MQTVGVGKGGNGEGPELGNVVTEADGEEDVPVTHGRKPPQGPEDAGALPNIFIEPFRPISQ